MDGVQSITPSVLPLHGGTWLDVAVVDVEAPLRIEMEISYKPTNLLVGS
jgi:hypothetical protein